MSESRILARKKKIRAGSWVVVMDSIVKEERFQGREKGKQREPFWEKA